MIVYLARDIPAFVMYCINGESGSSLLIESTDSMIIESTDSMIKDRGSEWGGILYYMHTYLKCHNYAVIYNCNEYLWKQNIPFIIIIIIIIIIIAL